MRIPNPLPSSNSQTLRRPRCILDLTPIHTLPRQLRDLFVTDLRTREAQFAYERRPDLFFGRLRELLEVQRDVDTGEEGFVECLDAVCGEEEDAAVVFDVAKAGCVEERVSSYWIHETEEVRWDVQDGYHRVALQLVQRALLKEHISLSRSR